MGKASINVNAAIVGDGLDGTLRGLATLDVNSVAIGQITCTASFQTILATAALGDVVCVLLRNDGIEDVNVRIGGSGPNYTYMALPANGFLVIPRWWGQLSGGTGFSVVTLDVQAVATTASVAYAILR